MAIIHIIFQLVLVTILCTVSCALASATNHHHRGHTHPKQDSERRSSADISSVQKCHSQYQMDKGPSCSAIVDSEAWKTHHEDRQDCGLHFEEVSAGTVDSEPRHTWIQKCKSLNGKFECYSTCNATAGYTRTDPIFLPNKGKSHKNTHTDAWEHIECRKCPKGEAITSIDCIDVSPFI